MSQTASDVGDDTESDTKADDPEIEEDLFEEELKIDGICGVY